MIKKIREDKKPVNHRTEIYNQPYVLVYFLHMRNDIRLFYTQVSQKTIKQSVIKLSTQLLDYLFNNLQPLKAGYVESIEKASFKYFFMYSIWKPLNKETPLQDNTKSSMCHMNQNEE